MKFKLNAFLFPFGSAGMPSESDKGYRRMHVESSSRHLVTKPERDNFREAKSPQGMEACLSASEGRCARPISNFQSAFIPQPLENPKFKIPTPYLETVNTHTHMEILVFLLIVTILLLVVSLRNSVTRQVNGLMQELLLLRGQLAKIQKPEVTAGLPAQSAEPAPTPELRPVPQPKGSTPLPPEPAEYWQSGFRREEEEHLEPAEVPVVKEIPSARVARVTATPPPPPEPKPGFFERHPDLEKFIGENLISKIGIAILVIAIGFFVKYAIDQQWIGAAARVGIGILCGGILIALAHRLRNSYRPFSSVLSGGGLAVLYFSITLAFQQFQLFGQVTAFVLLVVITMFSVALSLLYNKQEVAIIALVGGFATPFMASNGNNNYMALFTYLLILNTGLLYLAYFKAWRILNLLAFIFTVVLFGGWLFSVSFNSKTDVYLQGLGFGTAFYILFFLINIAHNIREKKKFLSSDFGILLANTVLYFGTGLYCLQAAGLESYRGIFTMLLGAFNLSLSLILFKNKKVDSNVLYLLIGITLSLISITAPVQLKGNYITLFWSSEAVLLYWLFQKSRIELIRLASMIVWVAMLISLCMDWNQFYGPGQLLTPTVIFNKGFITTVYAALSSFALFLLTKKDKALSILPGPYPAIPAIFFLSAALVLFYVSGLLELFVQFRNSDAGILYMLLYSYVFLWALSRLLPREIAGTNFTTVRYILLVGCVVIYLLNCISLGQFQFRLIERTGSSGSYFWAHWLSAVLLAFILYQMVMVTRKMEETEAVMRLFTLLSCFAVIVFVSVELYLLTNALVLTGTEKWETVQTQYIKIGLPIIWGLSSFGFMWLGMRFRYRPIRLISLVLFAITLVKLFVFDIRNISEGGKIAAFFCLGVLLLCVSFMYQRLKKIIIDDSNATTTTDPNH